MAATETAESGSLENKVDRADGDTNYPRKVLYCGGNFFFLKGEKKSHYVQQGCIVPSELQGACLDLALRLLSVWTLFVCVCSLAGFSPTLKNKQHTNK